MTPEDADRLREQVERLTTSQLGLLWRWITLAYFGRLHAEYGPKTPPPERPRRTRPRQRRGNA